MNEDLTNDMIKEQIAEFVTANWPKRIAFDEELIAKVETHAFECWGSKPIELMLIDFLGYYLFLHMEG